MNGMYRYRVSELRDSALVLAYASLTLDAIRRGIRGLRAAIDAPTASTPSAMR